MKCKALALLLLIVPAISAGYPLQSSNGLVNCTIFGTFKDPGFGGYSSSDSNSVLVVDASLTRLNESDGSPVIADYTLTDGNDRVYKTRSEYIKELQSGRQLIGFVVPKETIAKSLTIDLSKDAYGGERFIQSFPELVNISNDDVVLRYYGVLRSSLSSSRRTIELDVAVTNNGTGQLPLNSSNFTLKDQWGWRYEGKEYDRSTKKGLQPAVLEPNATVRSSLVFASISPLSRPAELVYRYSDDISLTMDIDTEAGFGQVLSVPENCTKCETVDDEPESSSSLAGSIKATKARLAKVKKLNNTEEEEPKGRDEL
ncbi:MAG: DUF4352 domain-containing protein [Methanothrix sp.]|jgi:hypothetical protein|nr:DUF4352 domain-containing protein [Methanothrix sp.]